MSTFHRIAEKNYALELVNQTNYLEYIEVGCLIITNSVPLVLSNLIQLSQRGFIKDKKDIRTYKHYRKTLDIISKDLENIKILLISFENREIDICGQYEIHEFLLELYDNLYQTNINIIDLYHSIEIK